MDHREIEDIAAAELLAGRADAYVSQTVAQMYENAIAVINVVEPLIRADEKAKVLAVEAMLVPATVEAELSFYRDDLRAKVEVLGPPQSSWSSPNAGEGWLDAIQAVLNLIDGSGDE